MVNKADVKMDYCFQPIINSYIDPTLKIKSSQATISPQN
jgi:hypothetical protein